MNRLRVRCPGAAVNLCFWMFLILTGLNFSAGVSSSSSSVTTGIEEQRFAIEPVDSNARLGESIILPCRVLHRTGPLQWTKDGFGLGMDRQLSAYPRYQMVGSEEEGDYSLEITNVQLEDDAVFQCQVGASEQTRGIRSRSAKLSVFVPPETLRIREGNRVDTQENKRVALTCLSEGGKPAAELTWLDDEGRQISEGIEVNREPLQDGKRFRTISTLSFEASRLHHNRRLHCRAENAALEQPQRASVLIMVHYTPKIRLWVQGELRHSDGSSVHESTIAGTDLEPTVSSVSDASTDSEFHSKTPTPAAVSTAVEEPIQVHVGENVTVFCEADANPDQPLSYKWFRGDQILTGPKHVDPQLQLNLVGPDWDGVRIGCEATNPMGSSGPHYRPLSVNFGPKLLRPLLAEQALLVGQSLRLQCDVRSNPPANLQWWHDGRLIAQGRTLNLSHLQLSNAGLYTCKALLDGFAPVTTSTRLLIKGAPRLISPTTQHGREGNLVQIECLVQSVPKASAVTWRKNGQIIDVDNKNGYELITEPLNSLDSTVRHVLLIRKARAFDFGFYNCSAQNELGETHMMIVVQPQRAFPMLMLVGALLAACLLLSLLGLFALWAMRRTSNKGDDLAASLNKCSSGSESTTLNLTQPANSSYNSAKLSLPDSAGLVAGANGSPAVSDMKLELGASAASTAAANHSHLSHLTHSGQQIHWDHEALLLNNNVLASGHLSHNYVAANHVQSGQVQLDGSALTASTATGPYLSRYQLLNGGAGTSTLPSVPSYVESIYNYPSASIGYAATNPLMNSCEANSPRTSPQQSLIANNTHPHSSGYLTSDGQSFGYGLCTAPVYLPPGYAEYAQLIDYGSLQQQQIQQQPQQQTSTVNQHSSVASSQISYETNVYNSLSNGCTRSPYTTNGPVAVSSPKQQLNLNGSPSSAITNNGITTNNVNNSGAYRSYITPVGNLQCMTNTNALATHV